MTTAGMRRLIKNPVVNSLEDGEKGRDKRKRDQHPLCAECDKRHGGTDCWTKHPELKPDWLKRREGETNKKKNKAHPHFTFGDPKPDTSMLTSFDDAGGDEVSFLMRDGQPEFCWTRGHRTKCFY
jgi:hypothetical protein